MNLLDLNNQNIIVKTDMQKKLTIDNKTKAYPVYKVRLNQLYYNDQNDRIATWLTKYKADNGADALKKLDREEYNKIIEKFIVDSNPEAIKKTKNNIELVSQREPGVVLADGRIVDGNRRFTCLRLLVAEGKDFDEYETVILEDNYETNKKQIKMLELAIQHGEEKKVDYDLIDYCIGTYLDIEETKLLTREEYYNSTNESPSEVDARINIAKLIIDFLEYIKLPGQYHIARELQVYSTFLESLAILKKCNGNEREVLKTSIFNNILLSSYDDRRKYVRDLRAVSTSSSFSDYIKEQGEFATDVLEVLKNTGVENTVDIKKLAQANQELADALKQSLEGLLQQTKVTSVLNKPKENINKSIGLVNEIDTRIVTEKLDDKEKKEIISKLENLCNKVQIIKNQIEPENVQFGSIKISADKNINSSVEPKIIRLAKTNPSNPVVVCINGNYNITNLMFKLELKALKYKENQSEYVNINTYLVDESFNIISDKKEVKVIANESVSIILTLDSKSSSNKRCNLIIKEKGNSDEEAISLIPFNIDIKCTVDFDF